MSGLETAAGVCGLITDTIAIIELSIKIYDAVRDKSGVTKELTTVSMRLPSIKELLKDAEKQYKAQNLGDAVWINAGADVQHCKAACEELHDLLDVAYPGDTASPIHRVFKNVGNFISRQGKKAEDLLKEIHGYLEHLKHRQIITNTRLLVEIKEAISELFSTSDITQNNVNGPNIGRDQNFTGGIGPMFNGPGVTYHAAGK